MPRPISGRRFAPKIKMMIARMISNSGIPMRPICHLVLAGTAAIVPCLAAGLSPWLVLHAQEPVAQFSSRVQLVEVYASVTDASGEPVTGLTRADFEVYEDDQRQDISTFAAGGVCPAGGAGGGGGRGGGGRAGAPAAGGGR